jgi:L-iditol 2-dehydrogenase
MEMCRDGGKYLVLGHYCNAGTIEFNPHIITRKQLQIFGSWSSEPRHLAAALDFMSSNRERFPFEQLISQRFSLERAHEALMTSRAGQSGKSVLTP